MAKAKVTDVEAGAVVIENGTDIDDKLSEEDGKKKKKEKEAPLETISIKQYVCLNPFQS